MMTSRVFRTCTMVLLLAVVACGPPAAPATQDKAPAAGSPIDAEWQKILDAAKKEGSVIIYGGIIAGGEITALAEEFRQQTGISFDMVSVASGAPLAQRIRTEVGANQPTADVFGGGSQFVHQLKKEGLFGTVKGQPLPVLREPDSVWRLHPLAMGPEGDIVVTRTSSQYDGHIIVNTGLLAESDFPKSYHEVATDPKYKGKLAYVDPKITGDVAARYVSHGYVTNTWSLADIWAYYANQSMMLFPGPNDQGSAVGRGEIAIGLGANSGDLARFVKAGAPVKILAFPDTPLPGNPNSMGVLKAAPHPNAALVWVNWFLSRDGQDSINKFQQTRSLRRDVASYVPDPLKGDVVGGGKKGPQMALTNVQSELASELHGANIFQRLPDGIPLAEFESRVNDFVKQWEAKVGGPQRDAIPLQE